MHRHPRPSSEPTDGLCPVCRSRSVQPFVRVGESRYWRCDHCSARFLQPDQRPTSTVERTHYQTHRNDPDDPGYRGFLAKLADPLLERLPTAATGLDYGCGPGPALAAMLHEAGHEVALYDPFFRPDPQTLRRTYDFITCTEVAEHFHRPAEEFDRLDRLLRPGGWLAVMTSFQTDDARFAGWHYRRDPTHVVFYREETFHTIAAQRGWGCEIPTKDVVLMRKRITSA